MSKDTKINFVGQPIFKIHKPDRINKYIDPGKQAQFRVLLQNLYVFIPVKLTLHCGAN
jgi:hypothetical protein